MMIFRERGCVKSAVELESDGQDRSLGPSGGFSPCFSIAGDFPDLGILKDRDVKLHGLPGLAVEP
jgi:hypothetical protein